MRVKRISLVIFSVVALSALGGCKKSSTTIPLVWKNPSYTGTSFQKLLVIGVGEDDGARRLFEDTFATAIADQGAAAQASWGDLPKSEQLTKEEIRAAGAVPFEFNTIGVDDGIAMGHKGMNFSLPSRELIADCVETMISAHWFDAMICIPNCDKIVPGMLMAAMRVEASG